jgi:hypothetical protein
MSASELASLIGAENVEHWDDIYADGMWLRVQPKGLGLDHRSETSNGDLAEGIHVHQTLEQAVNQEGRWDLEGDGCELVVIRGPEQLEDTGDVEGWVLPIGAGEIIGRFDYDALCDEADER